MALHEFGEYVSSFCFHGFFFLFFRIRQCHRLLGGRVVHACRWCEAEEKPEETLVDLRSEVETASPSCVIIAIIISISFVIAIATTAKCLSTVY